MNADQARALARRLYPGSTGFQGAFLDGWRAGLSGRGVDACPYLGGVRPHARMGWKPAWRATWIRGHGHGFRERERRRTRPRRAKREERKEGLTGGPALNADASC